MIKIFLSFVVGGILLMGFENLDATKQNIDSLKKQSVVIIDIRTPMEWKQTGIVQDSKTLMFFDSQGRYDAVRFLNNLQNILGVSKKVAIICRTGHRTGNVAPFLSDQGYEVVNLAGGVTRYKQSGGKLVRYK